MRPGPLALYYLQQGLSRYSMLLAALTKSSAADAVTGEENTNASTALATSVILSLSMKSLSRVGTRTPRPCSTPIHSPFIDGRTQHSTCAEPWLNQKA